MVLTVINIVVVYIFKYRLNHNHHSLRPSGVPKSSIVGSLGDSLRTFPDPLFDNPLFGRIRLFFPCIACIFWTYFLIYMYAYIYVYTPYIYIYIYRPASKTPFGEFHETDILFNMLLMLFYQTH